MEMRHLIYEDVVRPKFSFQGSVNFSKKYYDWEPLVNLTLSVNAYQSKEQLVLNCNRSQFICHLTKKKLKKKINYMGAIFPYKGRKGSSAM